ncbi:hypothetical protein LAC81_09805 [Ensifer adhaerens]|uniref:hypothetical protein n=1 Tax=Ensifer TaxID=106591 RepID=UPI000DE1C9AA|nr:hypothetical protein [Ensifer adhaerens]MBZ7922079.1 hypothetical protein [Ensifer adhaerens]UAX94467.1 hypothetical protein LAC78_09800 [Ensifer adhaerens]UAY02102.1 hypothetical protein LAC80_09810 [Ensifer adhaerens]UAY09485.1 hypothetical protein LAC81_09805 [Ensifer adhaerens]
MKIIIAIAASLAFAGSAFAAGSLAPADNQPAAKAMKAIELAAGSGKTNTTPGLGSSSRPRGKSPSFG